MSAEKGADVKTVEKNSNNYVLIEKQRLRCVRLKEWLYVWIGWLPR
jgi:hypothetical protein